MTRFKLINSLIRWRNYKTYLEIGTQHGTCFSQIDIDSKECVDIEHNFPELTYHMSSDDFFKQNKKTYDIIFVDGLHTKDQCFVDIENSLKVLNKDGIVVVHDCLPHNEEYTSLNLSGTSYQSIIKLRYQYKNLLIHVVDTDCGCALVSKAVHEYENCFPYDYLPLEEIETYQFYTKNKKDLMNVLSIQEFVDFYSK